MSGSCAVFSDNSGGNRLNKLSLTVLSLLMLFIAVFTALWFYVTKSDRVFDKAGELYYARINYDEVAVKFSGNGRLIIYTARDDLPENSSGIITKTEYICEGSSWKQLFGIFSFPEERVSSLRITENGHEGASLSIRCIRSFGYDAELSPIDMSSVIGTSGRLDVIFYGNYMNFGGNVYERTEELPPGLKSATEYLDAFSENSAA